MTWLDKNGRPVFRLSPDEAWPLPVMVGGQVAPAPQPEARVVPIKRRVAGG